MAEEVKVVDRAYLKKQFQNYNTKIVLPMFEQLDNEKVDKVEGYGLSKNDFTDELKAKLESLSNYDDTAITEAVAKIITDAPEDFDTLKEISDWISTHADSAAAMNTQITANKNSTETNAAAIALLNGDAETEGSVANVVATAMQNISLEDVDIDFDNLYSTTLTRSETISAISTSIEDTGTWTNKGTVTKTGETSYNYAVSSVEFAKDNRVIVNDCARFFGRLHDAGVNALVYNETTYSWNDELTLKGSRFANGETTLMSALATDISGTLNETRSATVSVTANGVEIALAIQIVNPTVEISGEAEVGVGSSITLTANAANAVWESSDSEVATVADGVVTGVSAGTATITVSAEGYNPGTKSITVNVVE